MCYYQKEDISNIFELLVVEYCISQVQEIGKS